MGCPSEVEIGDNLTFSVITHTPSTGAITDADAVPAYRIYEDETDPPILTGNMAKLDDDDTTGFYTETIACTSGNGFENGKTYTIYITAAVGGVTGGISYSFKAYDQRKANTIQLGSSTQSATDLKDFADSGYDPSTHKIEDCKVNDDMRGTDNAALASVCTEARLAELGATNIPADIDTLLTRIVGTLLAGNHTAQSGDAYAIVNNGTYGNSALKTLIDALATAAALATVDGNIDTLISRLTALRAGYLDNLSSGAVALEATLTAMKGAGWSDETLKAIKDVVDGLGGGGDASAANQIIIINHLTGIKGSGWVDENLKDIQETIDSVVGLTGSNAVTITIKDGDGNNIVECAVEIYDQSGNSFYERKSTDSNGQTNHNMDDGTYIIKIHKAGYVFDDETYIVPDDGLSPTFEGEAITVSAPTSAELCRLYTYFKDEKGDPVSSLTCKLRIVSLPFQSEYDSFHVGGLVDVTYNSSTGLGYWDVIRGARVKIVSTAFKFNHYLDVDDASNQEILETDLEEDE